MHFPIRLGSREACAYEPRATCVCVCALGLGLAEVPGRTEEARRWSAPGTIYSPELLMQEAANTVKSINH